MMTTFLFHPSDAALFDFAEAGRANSGPRRIVSHLEGCQRCRNRVAFRRDLHHAASRLARVEPPANLLDDILRDRAAGDRIILPSPRQKNSTVSRQGLRVAVTVGALIGVALLARYVRRSAETAPPSFLSATVFFPGIASASEPAVPRMIIDPVAPQIDGRQLRIREVSYQQQKIDAAGTRTIAGEGTTTVRPVVVAGSAAWRIERAWVDYATGSAPQSKEIDSMLLDGRDLHFIERYVDAVPYGKYSRITVTQKFGGDSVYGRMTSEGGDSRGVGRTFMRRLPLTSGPYTTDALAPLFFTTVRVGPGWHGRVSVLGWAVRDSDVIYPVDLKIVSRERVTVPAGSFDCWHFVITSGTHQLDFWARASDGLGVRVRNASEKPSPHVMETVLLRATP